MVETFQRCTNGHIIPKGATFCPWCGEAVQPGAGAVDPGDATIGSQPTAVMPQRGPHSEERHTVQFTGNPAAPEHTVVQYASGNPRGESGKGRLVGWLVSYDLDVNGKAFPLHEGRQSLGRDKSNDIFIEDTQLSKEHAIILYRNGRFIFEDKLSTNGSTINGRESIGQIVLNHGDMLQMGKHMFVFVAIPRQDSNITKGNVSCKPYALPCV